MAFRLQSALAGGAKRLSERLKTLEEDTKETAKTEAGRIAQEIADARKQRIADTLDYNTAGRKLKSQYGLSDAQVYTVLQGGIEGAEEFANSVRAGAIQAQLDKKEFKARDYAQNLFTLKDYGDTPAMTIEQQSAAYAAGRSPVSAENLVNQAADRIGVSTQTLLGQASPSYIKSLINNEVSAAAGQLPTYQGPAFGTGLPEGAGFTRAEVSPEDMIAIRKAEGEIALTGAQTESVEVATETAVALKDLKVEEAEARIDQINASTNLSTEQAARVKLLAPLEATQMQEKTNLTIAQVEQIGKNMQVADAQIDKTYADMGLTAAQIDLARAKVDQMLVSTELLEVDLAQKPERLQAELDRIRAEVELTTERADELSIKNANLPDTIRLQQEELMANIFLKETQAQTSQLNAQKIQDEIFLNQEFGYEERQAALNLVEAKIISENRFDDFEEYSLALMTRNDELRAALDKETNPDVVTAINKEIKDNEERIITVNRMDSSGTADTIFGKINETKTFQSMQANAAQGLDLDVEMGDMGAVVASLTEDKLPTYFKATNMAIQQFATQYGNTERGKNAVIAEAINLNQFIKDYANQNMARAEQPENNRVGRTGFGKDVLAQGAVVTSTHRGPISKETMTVTEATNMASAMDNLKEGDTATFINKSGREIYLIYSGGEWIGASY